jgi:NAD(P)-dependent dehydrogenase (short-subunit alcohol dehydrogenase family)
MDISGKTAIVTGAASGIGLGIATALAEAGANVVMADIQKAAVEEAAHGLSGTNKRVMPVRIDVTQEQSVLDALAYAFVSAVPADVIKARHRRIEDALNSPWVTHY